MTKGELPAQLQADDYLNELIVTNPMNNRTQKLGKCIDDLTPAIMERIVEYSPKKATVNIKIEFSKGEKNKLTAKTVVKLDLPEGKNEVELYLSTRNNVYKHNPEQMRMAEVDNIAPMNQPATK